VWSALVEEDGGGTSVDAMFVANTATYLIAMWSALVEEDGGGISVDAMFVANTPT
jgi:hypothetical protein